MAEENKITEKLIYSAETGLNPPEGRIPYEELQSLMDRACGSIKRIDVVPRSGFLSFLGPTHQAVHYNQQEVIDARKRLGLEKGKETIVSMLENQLYAITELSKIDFKTDPRAEDYILRLLESKVVYSSTSESEFIPPGNMASSIEETYWYRATFPNAKFPLSMSLENRVWSDNESETPKARLPTDTSGGKTLRACMGRIIQRALDAKDYKKALKINKLLGAKPPIDNGPEDDGEQNDSREPSTPPAYRTVTRT